MGVLSSVIRSRLLQRPVYEPSVSPTRHLILTMLLYLLSGGSFGASFWYFRSDVQVVSHVSGDYTPNCEPLQQNVGDGSSSAQYKLDFGHYEIKNKQIMKLIISDNMEEFINQISCKCTNVYMHPDFKVPVTDFNPDINPDRTYYTGSMCRNKNTADNSQLFVMYLKPNITNATPSTCKSSQANLTETDLIQKALTLNYETAYEGFAAIRDVTLEYNGPYMCETLKTRSIFESVSLSFSVFSVAFTVLCFIFKQFNLLSTRVDNKSEQQLDDIVVDRSTDHSVSYPAMV